MKYTVLIYENATDFSARTDEKRKDAYWGAYRAYTKALRDAGVMVGGAGLEPPRTATTLRQHDLCRGPGNVTMAMGITLAENRLDLLGDRLYIEDRGIRVGAIAWGPRIGIRVGTDQPWRAWVIGHPSVSGRG